MIRAGIIGAAGYTAGELIRILMNHPYVCISFAQSESHAGEPLWSAHQDLVGDTDMTFCPKVEADNADVIFICSGHGRSREAVQALGNSYKGAIIDLSNDFRLKADAGDFVYGLPEAFRDRIVKANHIANPGCFATCIQLALLPLAVKDLLSEIHVTGITGSTGAGQKPSDTTNFSWRSGNASVYKPFTHQHLGEISETLHDLAPSWNGEINFVPVRGSFTRGMIVSTYLDCDLSGDEASALYKEYYRYEPFVTVLDGNPDVKMVTNTNKCVLSVQKYGRKLHIISVIDNLVKGASGQAVQNMNLVCGLEETEGLMLKASRF